jgi:hypothetical protein
MSLGQNRRRIHVKGLGNAEIREVDPSTGASFENLGFIKSVTINDEYDMVDLINDSGHQVNYLPSSRKVSGVIELLQTSEDEINLLIESVAKLHVLRYHGAAGSTTGQWFCFNEIRLDPGVNLEFKVGERTLAVPFSGLYQEEASPSEPMYFLAEATRDMLMSGLELWLAPHLGYNQGTVAVLDISGFRRHGTIDPTGEASQIWSAADTPTPKYFLDFDGTGDLVQCGDVCDDDGSKDMIVEAWVRVQETDATLARIVGKKALVAGTGAGWFLYRNTSNQAEFSHGDGDSEVTANSTATFLQNVWAHVAAVIDRNGNVQMYVNGAASGSPVPIATQTTGTNAEDLQLAADGSEQDEVDIGDVRVYQYAAGALPANVATMLLNHYNGEKARYGLS